MGRKAGQPGRAVTAAVKRGNLSMTILENKRFDEERALYGSRDLVLRNSAFDGPADGESALKESRGITLENVFCNLRYPFWHDHALTLRNCELTALCRAALWYSEGVRITNTKLHGIKALRECSDVTVEDCDIDSPEFGWSTRGIAMRRTTASSEYFMLRAERLRFSDVHLTGKYSFQYITDGVFENCVFDTKDAFWHAKNVTVKNSVLKGEYLAWYAEGLTLEHCKIIGTQPFCYCRGLKLVDCEMVDTDLCFERSEVEATITTPVVSIKNPYAGRICVPAVGEVIRDDENAVGEVVVCPDGGKEKPHACACA